MADIRTSNAMDSLYYYKINKNRQLENINKERIFKDSETYV